METYLFNKGYFFNKFPIVKNISNMEIYTQRMVAIPKTQTIAVVNTSPQTVVIDKNRFLKNIRAKNKMHITILTIGYVNDVKSV